MSFCAVCYGTIQCYRCQVRSLRLQVEQLTTKLSIYENTTNDQLYVAPHLHQTIEKYVTRTNTPQHFDYKTNLPEYAFITLTFDPKKFGPLILDREECYYYIQQSLVMAKQKGFLTEWYGCIEIHQNGNPHAHIIGRCYQRAGLQQFLKTRFTDNMRNKFAVDIGPAKHPQAKEYIEKESFCYFSYKPSSQKHLQNVVKEVLDTESGSEDECNPLEWGLNNI